MITYIALALTVLAADEAEARKAIVWVRAGNQMGTATLVDERGYFLTAAHVVRGASSIELFPEGVTGDPQDGSFRPIAGSTKREWILCSSAASGTQLCQDGHDLALIYAPDYSTGGRVPKRPIDVELYAAGHDFYGGERVVRVGYKADDAARTQFGDSSHRAVLRAADADIRSALKAATTPEWALRIAYQLKMTEVDAVPGFSGGPILTLGDVPRIVGVTTWRESPLANWLAPSPTKPTYGEPGPSIRDLLLMLPTHPNVSGLAARAGGADQQFFDDLKKVSNIQYMQFLIQVSNGNVTLPAADASRRTLLQTLFKSGFERRLYDECVSLHKRFHEAVVIPPDRSSVPAAYKRASLNAEVLRKREEFLALEKVYLEGQEAIVRKAAHGESISDAQVSHAIAALAVNKAGKMPDEAVAAAKLSYAIAPNPTAAALVADMAQTKGDYGEAVVWYAETFRLNRASYAKTGFNRAKSDAQRTGVKIPYGSTITVEKAIPVAPVEVDKKDLQGLTGNLRALSETIVWK